MAATAASAMAHQLPPMSIPAMPRIRPPRMLKGEPHPNNAPPPQLSADSPVASRQHWVQGKWRPDHVKAVKHKRATQAIQVAKAVRQKTHGLDIYAYRHIRTNQVVYSLTRTLQENKVLKQLLYHGKKTVPATVRNDMWTPYFSIHFPSTPAGALEGLFAFQKLRELSIQRQLSPPENLIRATQEDIDIVKSKLGSPTTLQEMAVRDELKGKIPKLNEILPKKLRARKLMDHKATSVADAAFVLDWILSGPSPWERVTKVATNRAISEGEMSSRAARRVTKLRKTIEDKATEIRRRASMAFKDLAQDDRTLLNLDPKIVLQFGLEHQSMIVPKSDRLVALDSAYTERAIDIEDLSGYVLSDKVKKAPGMDAAARDERKQAIKAFKERQQTVKTAEHDALKEWFRTASAEATNGSVWKQVSLARENALDTFDTQQRIDTFASAAKDEGRSPSPSETNRDTHFNISTSTQPAWATAPHEVKIYWSDMNDGLFAASWPRSVIHGSLAPFAMAKALTRRWAPPFDEQGIVIPDTPHVRFARVVSKSVNIIGRGMDEGWVDEQLLQGTRRPKAWVEPPTPGVELEAAAEEEEVQVEYRRLDDGKRGAAVTHDPDIVIEERPKGVLGRLKGMFGR